MPAAPSIHTPFIIPGVRRKSAPPPEILNSEQSNGRGASPFLTLRSIVGKTHLKFTFGALHRTAPAITPQSVRRAFCRRERRTRLGQRPRILRLVRIDDH